jgi:phosphoglycerol transferase MdoB-like AlkP superfamily enzyme
MGDHFVLMNVVRAVLDAASWVAVGFMSAWVAHICLRCRPNWIVTVINLSVWVVPIALLIALTGQPWKSYSLGTTLVFVLQRIHWLKWKYTSDTWTAADLIMLIDRANWFVLRLYPFVAGFVAVCLAGLALSWLLLPEVPPLGAPLRLGALMLALGLIAFDVTFRYAHEFDPFGFNIYGHFANLLFSTSSLKYQPPTVTGDSRLFLEHAARLPAGPPRTLSRPPDLVVWLQESATDPRIFDVAGASLPALSMHESDARTLEDGWLRVPTWGGSTWLSEFGLLTGLTHKDFGGAGQGVFYTVTSHLRFSLPRLLKRHGYRCIVLFPVEKNFYNAESAYKDLGFDEILTPRDFPEWGNKSLVTNVVEDRDLCSYALKILSQSRSQPVFLYMLSMIQHGPYNASHEPAYGLDRSALNRPTTGRMSDWLSRMETLNRDVMDFDQELQKTGRNLILTYFGDHQPNLEGEVPMTGKLDQPRFLTRFAIKGPGDTSQNAGTEQILDIRFLGSLLLEHAGIAGDEFFAANAAMRRLCEGTLSKCDDPALAESYRAFLYHDLSAASGPVVRTTPADFVSMPDARSRPIRRESNPQDAGRNAR